ncbi:MAG: hypothetical protein MRZ79_13415 [Bacteroidia bacterium]|nr:hypothetical protein [Bacteroidia bacterium]
MISPWVVEDCLILDIADLKRHGYLDGFQKGILCIAEDGFIRAKFQVTSYPNLLNPCIEINYKTWEIDSLAGQNHSYEIELEKFRSNLGLGHRFYFLCPFSGVRCSRLHMPPGEAVFAHRSHWKGLFYECQRECKFWRKFYAMDRLRDKVEAIENRPYRKFRYKGKWTRAFWRMLAFERKSRL